MAKPQGPLKRSASTQVRLTPREHANLLRVADAHGLKAVDYIRYILRAAIDAHDAAHPAAVTQSARPPRQRKRQ
jgi:hypothetical protein